MKLLLGVCGGIAAYKAAAIVSFLVQRGDEVTVMMTKEATEFVGPLTFAALSGRRVYTSLWDESHEIPHVRLTREADAFVILPATANVLAKLAQGMADDLISNAALAARIPLLVAPAMNAAMYEHAATRENLRTLRARGVIVVEPGTGFLAERESGIGRLAEESRIVAAIDAALRRGTELRGERVVITAGPTREAIDPVRFLSNAATGTTGIALAREARSRGAEVDLVLGPTAAEPPQGVRVHHVVTAQELYEKTLALAAGADVAIASAAVADWRPAHPFERKVKKEDGADSIALERTPDTLAALGASKNGTFLVGFAAETDDLEAHALEKLHRKKLDAIVVNDVSGGRGFGTQENEVTVLSAGGSRTPIERAGKDELARRLWDVIAVLRAER